MKQMVARSKTSAPPSFVRKGRQPYRHFPRDTIQPKELFSSIGRFAPQFRGYQQQDSHELLVYLLSCLEDEEAQWRKNESHNDIIDTKSELLVVKSQLSNCSLASGDDKPLNLASEGNCENARDHCNQYLQDMNNSKVELTKVDDLLGVIDGLETKVDELSPVKFEETNTLCDPELPGATSNKDNPVSHGTSLKQENLLTLAERVFGGTLRSTVVCRACGKASMTSEPFVTLTLPIPDKPIIPVATGIASHAAPIPDSETNEVVSRSASKKTCNSARTSISSREGEASSDCDSESSDTSKCQRESQGSLTTTQLQGHCLKGDVPSFQTGIDAERSSCGASTTLIELIQQAAETDLPDSDQCSSDAGEGVCMDHKTCVGTMSKEYDCKTENCCCIGERVVEPTDAPPSVAVQPELDLLQLSQCQQLLCIEDTFLDMSEPSASCRVPSLYCCLRECFKPESLEGDEAFACESCSKCSSSDTEDKRTCGENVGEEDCPCTFPLENGEYEGVRVMSVPGSTSLHTDENGSSRGPTPATVKRPAFKQVTLERAPQVLVIHLNRFSQTSRGFLRKNTQEVTIPMELDISSFILSSQNEANTVAEGEKLLIGDPVLKHDGESVDINSCQENCENLSATVDPVSTFGEQNPTSQKSGEPESQAGGATNVGTRYKLQGMVVHQGGMGGGHYVAYVRSTVSETGWLMFSDSVFSEVKESTALSACPYLLFFHSTA
eukprot:Rmarinus@m.28283